MDSPLSKLGESMIDEAIANGSLTPPPEDTPLDLEAYFRTPEAWRGAHSMLKSNGFAPPEIEFLKEAAELEESLATISCPDQRRGLRNRIDQYCVRFRLATERLR
ncbi:MAG: DnaJ family domain-containing protein [Verrucomicrobiota bacterium]